MVNLQKEIGKVLHNRKLKNLLKKIDKLTGFRKVSPHEKKEFKAIKGKGGKTVYLLDPNVPVG
jgi:hypothetical protein